MTAHKKQELSVCFAELVYNGLWYSPLRKSAVRICHRDAKERHRHSQIEAV